MAKSLGMKLFQNRPLLSRVDFLEETPKKRLTDHFWRPKTAKIFGHFFGHFFCPTFLGTIGAIWGRLGLFGAGKGDLGTAESYRGRQGRPRGHEGHIWAFRRARAPRK
jgi:hypothetical protein